MSLVSRAIAFNRVDWRSGENRLRVGAFLAALGLVIAAVLLHGHVGFSPLGYTGVAVSALLASGGLVLPVPALAVACTAGIFLFPWLVAIIAGAAETAGELVGYFLGYSGRGLVARGRVYGRLESWMHRRGWLLLLTVSAVPNPLLDVVGIVAGASRYPLPVFLGVVLVGKLIKFLALVYACYYSVDWVTRMFT
jgi:membrane protein YqaA with SNARE-associated domain